MHLLKHLLNKWPDVGGIPKWQIQGFTTEYKEPGSNRANCLDHVMSFISNLLAAGEFAPTIQRFKTPLYVVTTFWYWYQYVQFQNLDFKYGWFTHIYVIGAIEN